MSVPHAINRRSSNARINAVASSRVETVVSTTTASRDTEMTTLACIAPRIGANLQSYVRRIAGHPRREGTQPSQHRCDDPARPVDRDYRAVRLRQIVPGVRYNLR